MTARPRHADRRPPAPTDMRLRHALADEIVALTHVLADLAQDLGANPATLRAHMRSLQSIDRLTQAHLAIADALRSERPVAETIGGISLESLSRSLAQRIDLSESRLDQNGRAQEWGAALAAQERLDDADPTRIGQDAVDAAD